MSIYDNPVLDERVAEIVRRIQELYLADEIPWVVGYSGGKDSTATLQLVWYALQQLPEGKRNHKPVHVISTDTLVEQPIVAAWVNRSLELMQQSAVSQGLNLIPHRLTPSPKDSFWVNLIGRGYPAPRQGFRWCTSRLKIQPSNQFILDQVRTHGETILVLGTRKAESTARSRVMERYEQKRIRQWLSPNASLPNSWVFTPIESWSNDDVWEYLITYANPWGHSNRELLDMYRGANPDNECPLVVDTSTPSCGGSRFGCWVCTVVTEDKSMAAMIQNDREKTWLTPLLDFRNELGRINEYGRIDDRHLRDFRRLDGKIKINTRDGRTIHGPYTKKVREYWLRRLLETEMAIKQSAPADMQGLRLITFEELREIRRIWLDEKHEFDDALPKIYKDVTGEPWPDHSHATKFFGEEEWSILENICDHNPVLVELQASLLDIEQKFAGTFRPTSEVVDSVVNLIKRCYYTNEEDALQFALEQKRLATARQTDLLMVQPSLFEELQD